MEFQDVTGFFGGSTLPGAPGIKIPGLKLPSTIPLPEVELPKGVKDWISAQFPSKAEVRNQIITWSIISAIATVVIIKMMKGK